MTNEEQKVLFSEYKHVAAKVFHRVRDKLMNPEKICLEDYGELVDIMKDTTEIFKNIAKVEWCDSEDGADEETV